MITWKSSLKDDEATAKIAAANLRLAVWALQLENADAGNPALSFVREMQIGGQHVTALVALSLYKPAAARIRSVFECALYYTYFRTHPSELQTLIRDPEYFVDKQELIDYHKKHWPVSLMCNRILVLFHSRKNGIARRRLWFTVRYRANLDSIIPASHR